LRRQWFDDIVSAAAMNRSRVEDPEGEMTGSPAAELARGVVRRFGGRYSSELGIDLDSGDAEIERWFIASTLFGTRISAQVAERTYTLLDRAGIRRITDVGNRQWGELVALLDAGGYARYDYRTATRLQDLAQVVMTRYEGDIGEIGRRFRDPETLASALEALPGWGPVTTGLFLRELRGVWPGANPPLDQRAADAAGHLGLLSLSTGDGLARISKLAQEANCDVRDLESGLVRLALAHRRVKECPGLLACVAMANPTSGGSRDRA
jgi:hypothetical protein